MYKDATWIKSSKSSGSGQCVEVAFIDGDTIAVRDSKNRTGPVLTFTSAEWRAFLDGAQVGEFEQPQ